MAAPHQFYPALIRRDFALNSCGTGVSGLIRAGQVSECGIWHDICSHYKTRHKDRKKLKVPKELATASADSPKGVLRKHGLNIKEIMVSNLSKPDEVNFLAKNAGEFVSIIETVEQIVHPVRNFFGASNGVNKKV